MMRVLKFLAGIKPDQTGLSFALPRSIQKGTRLLLHDVYEIIEEAEKEGLVRTMRTNLSGPDGILSAMITEKGRSRISASCYHFISVKTLFHMVHVTGALGDDRRHHPVRTTCFDEHLLSFYHDLYRELKNSSGRLRTRLQDGDGPEAIHRRSKRNDETA